MIVDSGFRMSIFNPLRIEVDVATSEIDQNADPVHLDALLYWSIHGFLQDHESVMSELDIVLSKSNGVYHASQALFETDRDIHEKSKNKNCVKQNVIHSCNQFSKHFTSQFKKVVFFAHGNAEKINFYLRKLSSNDTRTNIILGNIEKVSVKRVVDDYSWFLDDKLNRILPISLFYISRMEPVRSCRYVPNYASSLEAECYVPTNNTLTV